MESKGTNMPTNFEKKNKIGGVTSSDFKTY